MFHYKAEDFLMLFQYFYIQLVNVQGFYYAHTL